MDEEWVDYDGGAVQEWHRSARRIRVASDVAVIPAEAFRGCTDLRAVDLNHVTTIPDYVFSDCRSLERVVWTTTYAVEIGEGAFSLCRSLQEIDLSNATRIGPQAFFHCYALRRVSIPSSVEAIGDLTFASCSNLVHVELGEGIQRIEKSAFARCSSLVQIRIPPSVTAIGYQAFDGCAGLQEVELNEGLQRIGYEAFGRCTSLQSINIPSTVLEIGQYAFHDCRQLRSLALQEGLQAIRPLAFLDCHSLERITIPSSITLVGKHAFWNCNNLAEVTLLEGIQWIDTRAFDRCHSLDHINIPPVAFVIDIAERSSCHLMRTTMPNTYSGYRTYISALDTGGKLVVSKWVQYRSPSQLAQAEAKVNGILDDHPRTEEEKILRIRELFAYYDRLDVTTLLELAVWRVNMDGNVKDREARQAIRGQCGNDMNVIIPSVLPFLEG